METSRWNFEATDNDVLVCRALHEKGEECEYEKMSPAEIVELLETYRRRTLKLQQVLAELMTPEE